MRKLKLGIIGTGIATNDLYWPQLKRLKSKIEIVAVANRRVFKAKAFAKIAKVKHVCASGDELLKRPDVEAVMISLPIEFNATWVLKALKAGKHVICEKPIAANSAEAKRLIKAAAKYKRLWLVGENYFFTPHIAAARRWALSGKLGKVRLVESLQIGRTLASNKYFKTPWRQNPKFVGGFVVDAGVHVANVTREMFGMPKIVKSLSAQFDPILKPIDTAVAAFQFKNGALGIWRSCFSALSSTQGPMLKAYGSKGTIEVHGWHSVYYTPSGKEIIAKSVHNGFYHQFEHFAEAVTRKKRLKFSPRQALADLEFMEQIVK